MGLALAPELRGKLGRGPRVNVEFIHTDGELGVAGHILCVLLSQRCSPHRHKTRYNITSLVGPVVAEIGTVRCPHCSAPLQGDINPSTTHCSWGAAPNMEGPGCWDRVTAYLRDLCSVTQELETFPRAASANRPPLCSPTARGTGSPRGGHPLTHPQDSPGCEKAEPGVPGTINSAQHLTGDGPSRQLCVTALSLPES